MTVITGVHHIALKCKGIEHFEKTVSFYRDILGVPAVRQWGKGTESESCLNPGIIEIFSDGNDIPAKVQYAMSPLHQSLEAKKYMEN